jgi:hypothetical protein
MVQTASDFSKIAITTGEITELVEAIFEKSDA